MPGHRSFRKTISFALACLALILASTRPTPAVMAELTTDELVQMSAEIVRGKVLAVRSHWNSDSTQIMTTVRLRRDHVYAGSLAPDSEITIVCPGGEVGGIGLWVEHAPVFKVGEKCVVFLTAIDQGRFRVAGWEAGKFTVVNDKVRENGLRLDEFTKKIEQAVTSAKRGTTK